MAMDVASSCLICSTPLAGALGALGRAAGIHRSSQNPNLCDRCDVHVQEGRIVEVAVFFADLTGFTTLTHDLGPERTHEVVDAFLRMAKDVVVKWDGFVVQFAGDEIMALFNVPLRCEDYARRAVAAAREIQRGLAELSARFGQKLQVTVGIAAGHARVGRLGSDHMKDYTAVGDVVNRAARLVANVEPDGILVDAEVYAGVRNEFPGATPEHLSLKGFAEPVEVDVRLPLITLAAAAALANLAAVGWSRWQARSEEGAAAKWARGLRPAHAGIFVSIGALSMIAFELVAHAIMH